MSYCSTTEPSEFSVPATRNAVLTSHSQFRLSRVWSRASSPTVDRGEARDQAARRPRTRTPREAGERGTRDGSTSRVGRVGGAAPRVQREQEDRHG